MFATIDVGSNTVRMLLGKKGQGRLIPVRYERAVTRLGGDFAPKRGLAPESMERTLAALKQFSEILKSEPTVSVRAVGTAALRRAQNRDDFIRAVQEQTGLQLEVIDGKQEAQLTSLGVLEALDPQPAVSLVIDIGGGSTELILLEGQQVRFRQSYQMGVVRLCEEFASKLFRQTAIDNMFTQFSAEVSAEGLLDLLISADCEYVGTAGTVTTLAAFDQKMENYDWSLINNYLLPLDTLQEQYQLLTPLTPSEREALPGLEPGRGDLIVPGLEILLSLLKRFPRSHLRVSDFGLLEGLMIELDENKMNRSS